MIDFPQKLKPENLPNFKSYQTKRNICKIKQIIYDFMLSDDFITNKNRGIELNVNFTFTFISSKKELLSLLELVIQDLINLGWSAEISFHDSFLFIYPPNDKPKLLDSMFM